MTFIMIIFYYIQTYIKIKLKINIQIKLIKIFINTIQNFDSLITLIIMTFNFISNYLY